MDPSKPGMAELILKDNAADAKSRFKEVDSFSRFKGPLEDKAVEAEEMKKYSMASKYKDS